MDRKKDSPKSTSTEAQAEDKLTDRRAALKHMGKLAYVAPALSIISFDAQSDVPTSPPFPTNPEGIPLA